ncbi:endonuclease domain-containing protein [Patescibacteria group bacterium]
MQTQDAIVGIVPRENLWLIIQKEKWYHIPVKPAPENILDIKYIAFYFPECFDEEKRNKIIYYAKVVNIDKVKRIQLFPEEVTHENAQNEYYKLYLDQIEKLSQIIPCERRIIHIPTNKQKLFTAKEHNDLYDASPLEDIMYQAIKKRKIAVERQSYVKIDNEKYFLDLAIFCRSGKIDIECDGKEYHSPDEAVIKDRLRNNQLASHGWCVLRFSGQEINHNIENCINVIEKTIHNLGGLCIMP